MILPEAKPLFQGGMEVVIEKGAYKIRELDLQVAVIWRET